jgi:25S rRNA (uracil2843-N3)-methyltransferase
MTQNKRDARSRPASSRSHGKSKDSSKTSKLTKPTNLSSSKGSSPLAPTSSALIPLELQQLLLNIFRDAFPGPLSSGDELTAQLQSVKGALFARDFERAFGRREWLEAYAVRWSTGRAVAYAEILGRWWGVLTDGIGAGGDEEMEGGGGRGKRMGPVRVICFGGGAAEVVALGGLVRHRCREKSIEVAPDPDLEMAPPATAELDVQLIDSASWGPIISLLHTGLAATPRHSKYARASAEPGAPLLPDGALTASFLQADLLAMSRTQLSSAISGPSPGSRDTDADVAPAVVVTLLFTLNELYAASVAKTTRFLLDVTAAVRRGSALLVVDSPGSYSEAGVGNGSGEGGSGEEEGGEVGGGGRGGEGKKKKYPMQWLLDHTLLGRTEEHEPLWEKVLGEESRWFRLDERLRYPISLENMRYQVHIYRRL